jgi:diguanylate cyclase (GGDEF)-like protein
MAAVQGSSEAPTPQTPADPASTPIHPADAAPAGRSAWRRHRLLVACVLATVIGLCASLAVALTWRSSVNAREKQSFQTTAADITGTLSTQLRRDSDFVRAVRALLDMQPNVSSSGLNSWFRLLEDRKEQQVGQAATVTRVVPAADLNGFLTRRNADPAFRRFVDGHVLPVPASGRASYCLLSAGSSSVIIAPSFTGLLQGDWCDPRSPIGGGGQNGVTRAQATQMITDSGQFVDFSLHHTPGTSPSLIIEGAFYRPGAPTATVAQRRAAVLGWMEGSFDIQMLMQPALEGVRGFAVTLYHANPGLAAEFIGSMGTANRSHPFTHTATLHINGDWLVKVSGAPLVSGLSADMQALVVFFGVTLSILLLLALVLSLSRQRERAMDMVREKTRELRRQALHDALTGLPNRVLALDRAEQMLARARRRRLPVAALYVDVDGFKQVNDTFGHAAGDELLRIVASRLRSITREGDTAARLGGDEFVVLLDGSSLDAGPELVAERLLETLREPYEMHQAASRPLSLSASIGIAYGLRGTAEELLRDADTALYVAKGAGKNRCVLFESEMNGAQQDRLTLQMDLTEGLAHEQLFLLYQPTFDLQSERVTGVEALLRWRHPTRGVVSPEEFIPIAEANGLIVPIGRWVLHEACRQAAAWHAQGHHVGMAVNVSARQLDTGELIDDVRKALRDTGLDPAALTLEITESALMRDPEATAARLRSLKALGVRIAIDDFGTGYSSLAYLRQFPVDTLKIDRSFISGIATSGQSTALIHTLVQLGKTLNIETLAEGIEDQDQLRILQRQHCDQGQGFLFSRPLEVSSVEAFLEAADAPMQMQPAR